jgi:Glycosyltransferase 61
VPKRAIIQGWEQLHFHFFPPRRLDRLRAMWGDISIREEQPGLIEVPGGVTTPGSVNGKRISGVYDRDNRLIASSPRIRGKDSRVDGDADLDDLLTAREDGRDAYYLGRGENHYGHFILETLCRAWAWKEHGRDRVPILQAGPRFARALWALIPGLLERMEIIKAPTRFRNIVVPGAAFVIARAAHVEFKRMCERMTEQALKSCEPVTEQPLYLSRAGLSLSRRTIEGEVRLERLLEREGFLIVRPETLPVTEQIALVNRHRCIVSPLGSACHTRLFSRIPTDLITITPHYFTPNYVLCDLLCEGSSHYVNAFTKPDIGTRVRLGWFVEPTFLHEDRLVEFLKSYGLVRPAAALDGPPPSLKEYKLRWIAAAQWQTTMRPEEGSKILKAIEEVTASLEVSE